MSVPLPLRRDFDASRLRGLAKKTKDGPQARRLLALAAIYDGATRTEAAKIGGVGLQIVRDWVMRFNARGPDGLLDGKAPGQPSKLDDAQRQSDRQDDREPPNSGGPRRGALAADRSGAMDLRRVPHHHRQADLEPGTAGHGLSQALGPPTSSCSSRRAPSRISKNFPTRLDEVASEKAIKCRDHRDLVPRRSAHRSKNKITRRWAKRGIRPSAPRDQRTASTYIFGAVCPSTRAWP